MIKDPNDIKIFGLYPGVIESPNVVRNLSEVELYHFINYLSLVIKKQEEQDEKEMKRTDLSEERYALAFAVNQTRKFGVELPWPSLGEEFITTSTFNIWYGFYHNHFNSVLSPSEFNNYQKALSRRGDVSKYMPKGKWKNMLDNEVTKQLNLELK